MGVRGESVQGLPHTGSSSRNNLQLEMRLHRMLVSVWQFLSASVLYRTTQFLLLKWKPVTVSIFNNSFIISDALTSWIFHPGKKGPNNILNHWMSDEKCFCLLASRSSCTSVSRVKARCWTYCYFQTTVVKHLMWGKEWYAEKVVWRGSTNLWEEKQKER